MSEISTSATKIGMTVALHCRCGEVRGDAHHVSPKAGFRLTCYCRDCQAFARFLGRADSLDAAGGTDIFQMPVGRLTIQSGQGHLACVQLSPQVFRWYAACCNTPIGNSAGAKYPLIGVIHTFIDQTLRPEQRREILGPARCRLFENGASAALLPDAPPPPSFGLMALRLTRLAQWFTQGLNRPNPFFDTTTGMPFRTPTPLSEAARAKLYERGGVSSVGAQ